ncbi:MAG: threonine-phosphate decarboxylase CobD [Pseudomonadota bacterium]
MLEHGGRLREAAARHGIAPERWLDLSTGINPDGWPVPALPPEVWRRLPETGDGLEAAARRYYGTAAVLPVAGSQAAIQALPWLRPRSRVGVLAPTYAEHARAWQRAGHDVLEIDAAAVAGALDALDVLVLVNPNNPTGQRWPAPQLLQWRAMLAARGGWLVVDEAFADPAPQDSLAAMSALPGLVVLRSLGKFFGLAGARVGFVLAPADLLAALDERLGPWAVAHPARAVATLALADDAWQRAARRRLDAAGARLAALLSVHGLEPAGTTALFAWVATPDAEAVHDFLARQGILTRRFAAPRGVRFGLPGDDAQWQRLEAALAARVRALAPARAAG